MRRSHVYLLPHATEPRLKIGKADNVQSRANQIGKENFCLERGFVFELGSRRSAFNLERVLQRVFSQFHLPDISTAEDGATEWFDLGCLDLVLRHATENAMLLDIETLVLRSGTGERISLRTGPRGQGSDWCRDRGVCLAPAEELRSDLVYSDYCTWCRHHLLLPETEPVFWMQVSAALPGVGDDVWMDLLAAHGGVAPLQVPLRVAGMHEGRPFRDASGHLLGQQLTLLRCRAGGAAAEATERAPVRDATYRARAASVRAWAREQELELAAPDECWAPRAEVYEQCLSWCCLQGCRPPTPRGFYGALKQMFPALQTRTLPDGHELIAVYLPGLEYGALWA